MNVSLTPELEALVHQKVKTGRYSTASEVVRDALRQMEQRDHLDRLRAALAPGIAEADRGEGVELKPRVWDALERRADEEERQRLPLDPQVCP